MFFIIKYGLGLLSPKDLRQSVFSQNVNSESFGISGTAPDSGEGKGGHHEADEDQGNQEIGQSAGSPVEAVIDVAQLSENP